jgi:hypothetical protein
VLALDRLEWCSREAGEVGRRSRDINKRVGGNVDEGLGGEVVVVDGIIAPILALNGLAGLGVNRGRSLVLTVRGGLLLEIRLGSTTTSGLGHSTLGTLRSRHREC